MTRRSYLFLFLISLAVQLAVAHFQTIPGYLDGNWLIMK